jgi:hypothetical protein
LLTFFLSACGPATPTTAPACAAAPGIHPYGLDLVRDGPDWRLRVGSGFVGGRWLTEERFLVSFGGSVDRHLYVADLRTGSLQPTGLQNLHVLAVSPSGRHLLVEEESTRSLGLHDLEQGRTEYFLSRKDGTVWTAGGPLPSPPVLWNGPVWLDDRLLVLHAANPENGFARDGYYLKGVLLLVDQEARTLRVLGESDRPPAVQGRLILRVDGEALFVLPPPYTGASVSVAAEKAGLQHWTASPDGVRIAWVRAAPSVERLVLFQLEGARRTEITLPPGRFLPGGQPLWSADGSRLWVSVQDVSRDDWGEGVIWEVKTADGSLREVARLPGGFYLGPAGPDGNGGLLAVAFRRDGSNEQHLYRFERGGAERVSPPDLSFLEWRLLDGHLLTLRGERLTIAPPGGRAAVERSVPRSVMLHLAALSPGKNWLAVPHDGGAEVQLLRLSH